jgi:hypothetical protein
MADGTLFALLDSLPGAMSKSFLVLFFKKELFPLLLLSHD